MRPTISGVPRATTRRFTAGLRILTESASARLATPMAVTPDQIDEDALGYKPREKTWNYLEPWLGGTWQLRDIIDYQEIAFESLLYNAAMHREDMLRNFYKVGEHQIERTSPWGDRDFEQPARSRRHAPHAGDAGVRRGRNQTGSRRQFRHPHAAALFRIRQGAARTRSTIPICCSIPAARRSALTMSPRTLCRCCSASMSSSRTGRPTNE